MEGIKDIAEVVITTGALASALWEVGKWVIRSYIVKDAEWSLPVKVNLAIVAVLAYVLTPLLAYLGIGEYQLPVSWEEFGRQFVMLIFQVLIAMVTHGVAFKGATTQVKWHDMEKSYRNDDLVEDEEVK